MMTRLSLLSIALAVAASPSAVAGFTASNHQSRTTSTELSAVGNNRRNFLSAVTGSVLVGAALPAWAEISQGTSLPQGAQQFSTMIRVKGDLKSVQKRVQDAPSDMNAKEWDNISQFLRQIYQTGDDMKAIANGIYDPEKKKQALADADSLRKAAKSADVPVSKQDAKGFLAIASKMDETFEDFMVQLSDVPDEI